MPDARKKKSKLLISNIYRCKKKSLVHLWMLHKRSGLAIVPDTKPQITPLKCAWRKMLDMFMLYTCPPYESNATFKAKKICLRTRDTGTTTLWMLKEFQILYLHICTPLCFLKYMWRNKQIVKPHLFWTS